MRETLEDALRRVAVESDFSGVVRVDDPDGLRLAQAYGLAHRASRLANSTDTLFAIASGTKGLTALTVVSLIEQGQLSMATTARSVLGADLPLIGDDVTVEHLLAHRSGIGDYLDEESDLAPTDYLMPVSVHELATTEQYLRVLAGHVAKFPPGERFGYCNSGYVVLALLAERVGGVPFHELVRQRVCEPAGMSDTEFLRSDELPGRAATGYLTSDGLRSNIFHLPVRGSGDGGIYTTAADVHLLWSALHGGHIVSRDWVTTMLQPVSDPVGMPNRYGLGFWLQQSGKAVLLEGSDAGVSFRSVHDPVRRVTHTVISNTTAGAWPIARYLDALLTPD